MLIDPDCVRIVERIANEYFDLIVDRMYACGARKVEFGLSPALIDTRFPAGWEQELTPATSARIPLNLTNAVHLDIERKGLEHAVRLDIGESISTDQAPHGLVIGWTFITEDRYAEITSS